MTSKRPLSFSLFITVVIVTLIGICGALFYSRYFFDSMYSIVAEILIILILVLCMAGIFIGAKAKYEDKRLKLLNRIGIMGNLVVLVLLLGRLIITTF